MAEEKKFRRIGVLTSGGDSPGMNAAVRAVTRAALLKGVQVMGIYEGYKGLIDNDMQLYKTPRDVANIINNGGTKLYSAREPRFREVEGMQTAIANCKKNEIDGIVAIGGDGTFRGATDLTNLEIPCIGLPGTIDNDITATDYSIGFDTAMNTAVENIDRLRDTCLSHARCNVVELMGRDAGYIALETGIAVGATSIILLETFFGTGAEQQYIHKASEAEIRAAIERVQTETINKIKKAKCAGKRDFIVVIAEGVPINLKELKIDEQFSEKFTERIGKETGIDTRFVRPLHILRGGSPTLRDRLLATRMGYKAVELLLDGQSNLVVCEQRDRIVSFDINDAQALDQMYKGKVKEGVLEKIPAAKIEVFKQICADKRAQFLDMYKIADDVSH
jgi:6-phosphofructokinase 1